MSALLLVPAYGRDYKSQAAVKADWDGYKDFFVADMFNSDYGRAINKQDAMENGVESVKIRYDSLRKFVFINQAKKEV